MEFDIVTLLFYFFAFLTLASGLMVITAKNPVHSVLFLIFAFFNVAGLFVLLGAEYLAMLLVIVYVGAVAVLFLFVVMMLDINFAEIRQGFVKRLPLVVTAALAFFVQLGAILYASAMAPIAKTEAAFPTPTASEVSNTEAIGQILYTDYVYAFQISGLILLVAMIGAIVLSLRTREGVLKQDIGKQVSRTREESIELVKVKSGEGV